MRSTTRRMVRNPSTYAFPPPPPFPRPRPGLLAIGNAITRLASICLFFLARIQAGPVQSKPVNGLVFVDLHPESAAEEFGIRVGFRIRIPTLMCQTRLDCIFDDVAPLQHLLLQGGRNQVQERLAESCRWASGNMSQTAQGEVLSQKGKDTYDVVRGTEEEHLWFAAAALAAPRRPRTYRQPALDIYVRTCVSTHTHSYTCIYSC